MPHQEFNLADNQPNQGGSPSPLPSPAGFSAAGRLASLKQGNLLLAVLFVAGLGCVYLMSLRNGPARASAQQKDQELKVDSALTQLRAKSAQASKGGPTDTNGLVDTFYYETRQRQIPAEEMPGNPFEFKAPVGSSPMPVTGPTEEDASNAVGAKRLSEALEAARQLKLQSILTGANGATAMVSNNLLTEGQIIVGWTVKKIEGRQVTLAWNDQTYVLKMP